jgi:hypothetical protein
VQRVLDKRPRLTEGEAWFMRPFFDLSTCRAIGMSIGQIPWTAIDAYGRGRRMEPDVLDTFTFVIREMDAEYLKYVAEQSTEPPASKGSGKRGTRRSGRR